MAVEGDSYCATADVVALVQMGAYGASTVPTAAQGLEFQQNIAGEIYIWMSKIVGTSAPGPAAYSTTVNTGTDMGLALDALLIQANAYGAAALSLEAAGASDSPARSERIAELWAMYQAARESIEEAVEVYVGSSSLTSNHITEGRITEATLVSREEEGLTFNAGVDPPW